MTDSSEEVRYAYFISDRTGITSESLGEALLNQFDNITFKCRTYPYVDSPDKAKNLIKHIEEESDGYGRPLIFSSIVDRDVRNLIHTCNGFHIDFFDTFIDRLEDELHIEAKLEVGRTHGIGDTSKYDKRIDAVNFTLNHDDGISDSGLQKADVILVGVSRSGKTPTCLYLALQYGIRAANYPLTPDDLQNHLEIPRMLKPHRKKLFGLTINSERLHNIRQERRPDSVYADLENCRKEVRLAEEMFERYDIPYLSTTHKSVEELAVSVMQACNLRRRF